MVIPRFVAFVDESANQEHYRVGALIVETGKMKYLSHDLQKVVSSAARHGIDPDAELHGHELFHGQGGWEPMRKMSRARISTFREALLAVVTHGEAVLIRGVHRRRYRANDAKRNARLFNEHSAALMYTLEEIDRYAEKHRGYAIVMADQHRLAQSTQDQFERFQRDGTWGYRPRRLDHLVSLDYLDSADSRPIQGIDLVMYLKNRISSGIDDGDGRKLKVNQGLWDICAGLVEVDRD